MWAHHLYSMRQCAQHTSKLESKGKKTNKILTCPMCRQKYTFKGQDWLKPSSDVKKLLEAHKKLIDSKNDEKVECVGKRE